MRYFISKEGKLESAADPARARAAILESTSSFRCCTALSARTARFKACWNWRISPYVGPGVLAFVGGDG